MWTKIGASGLCGHNFIPAYPLPLQSGAGKSHLVSHLVWGWDVDVQSAEADAAGGASQGVGPPNRSDASAKGASPGGEGDKERPPADVAGACLGRSAPSTANGSSPNLPVGLTSWLKGSCLLR